MFDVGNLLFGILPQRRLPMRCATLMAPNMDGLVAMGTLVMYCLSDIALRRSRMQLLLSSNGCK